MLSREELLEQVLVQPNGGVANTIDLIGGREGCIARAWIAEALTTKIVRKKANLHGVLSNHGSINERVLKP